MSERGGKRKSSGSASPSSSPAPAKCDALQRALIECHHRIHDELQRSIACRHLNRSLAECLLSASCPEEAEAVRSLCSSAGTSLKRSQCRDAQLSLSVCLASRQESD
ncbi:hypothetical protein IEQ34_001767 [Dendrobium chrysotoxum]|uniref:COX assembly mitochondrial protein n=1 Tax=Dendrobium chrysotoxum TaxID=161865 RepID=A0AAV7HQZ6_DENCH|nr:hypothetical protein IEQ34_001767 [Dendrobium chrysotoxum]